MSLINRMLTELEKNKSPKLPQATELTGIAGMKPPIQILSRRWLLWGGGILILVLSCGIGYYYYLKLVNKIVNYFVARRSDPPALISKQTPTPNKLALTKLQQIRLEQNNSVN